MVNEYQNVISKIKEYDTIIIHRHMRPDGDCIACQMGLKDIILTSFPGKKVFAVGDDIPDYLSFLGKDDLVSSDIYKEALVIVVDTSIPDRIYDERWKLGKEIIKIDHHDDSEQYGSLEIVKPESPACAVIITDMYMQNKEILKMSIIGATALFTGIVTDTGRFQYRGLNGITMLASKELLDFNIDYEEIYARLYTKDIDSFRLQGYLYNNFKTTKNGVAYIIFKKPLMEKYHVTKEDAAALINTLSGIKGSIIWVSITDYDDNYRVRLRSRYVPINDIGVKYRGGGHIFAAGATVYDDNEIKSLLKDLDKRIKDFKKQHPEVF